MCAKENLTVHVCISTYMYMYIYTHVHVRKCTCRWIMHGTLKQVSSAKRLKVHSCHMYIHVHVHVHVMYTGRS